MIMALLVQSRNFQFSSLELDLNLVQSFPSQDPEDPELGPVVEVSLDRPHRVEESCLDFCLTHQHQQMHLF